MFKGHKITYFIEGLNSINLINALKNDGINCYKIKKLSPKKISVSIDKKDEKKFFAKCDNMCYNIKKVKESGAIYPFFCLYKRLGLLFGTFLFIILAVFFNNIMLAVDIYGDDVSISKAKYYLSKCGVEEYAFFNSINLDEIEKTFLSSGSYTFVSVKKSGNRLVLNLKPTEQEVKLNLSVDFLKSDACGEVYKTKIYNGIPLVNVGDMVNEGDLLVDGGNVIATVILKREFDFEYHSFLEGEETIALMLAEEKLNGKEIIDKQVEREDCENGFIYKVKLLYLHMIFGG